MHLLCEMFCVAKLSAEPKLLFSEDDLVELYGEAREEAIGRRMDEINKAAAQRHMSETANS